jgi:hypothetical protein
LKTDWDELIVNTKEAIENGFETIAIKSAWLMPIL